MRNKPKKLILSGTPVEIRIRRWRRWTSPRQEVFLAGGKFSSGMLWKVRNKWHSTEGPTFSSRRNALLSLIRLCILSRPAIRRLQAAAPSQLPVVVQHHAAVQRLAICPTCRASVRLDRLARHIQRVHGVGLVKPTSSRVEAPAVVLPRVSPNQEVVPRNPGVLAAKASKPVKCRVCGAFVAAARLKIHLRHTHSDAKKRRAFRNPPSLRHGLRGSSIFKDHRFSLKQPFQGGRPDSNRRRH